MSILIIRPVIDALKLSRFLSHNNIDAIALPLFKIKKASQILQLDDKIKTLNKNDLLIATSKYAVLYANEYLQSNNLNWPQHVQYAAVGATTGKLLAYYCKKDVIYPDKNNQTSEGLLEIIQPKNNKAKQALIIKGNKGRNTLKNELEIDKITVKYCEVYQRQALKYDINHILLQKKSRIDAILITSEQQLKYLCLIVEKNLQSWLYSLRIYVPSKRIKEQALILGFTAIITVGYLDYSIILATLRDDKHNGKIK